MTVDKRDPSQCMPDTKADKKRKQHRSKSSILNQSTRVMGQSYLDSSAEIEMGGLAPQATFGIDHEAPVDDFVNMVDEITISKKGARLM